MSTLTQGQTTTTLATLPRVNLLPPEIAAQRRLKKIQTGLGLGVLAAAGVVGALALAANAQVSSAQDELDAAKAQNTSLQSQAAKYKDVPVVYAQVDAAKAQLSQAMGQEVRWSYFLNDLSLLTPSRVWLTSVTVTQQVDQSAVVPGPTAPGATYGTPGIGTVTFQGKGSTHNDVAAWLKALAGEPGLADAYFTRSSQEKIGSEDAVSFDSQAVLTDEALSGRYSTKAGS